MAIENEKLIIKCGIFNIRSNFLYKDLIINFLKYDETNTLLVLEKKSLNFIDEI